MRLSTSALPFLVSLASAELLSVTQPTPASDSPTALPIALLDTNVWSPISTITGLATPTDHLATSPTSTSPPSIFDKISSYIHHDLLRRSPNPQGGAAGQAGAAPVTVATQMSPITTAEMYTYKDGQALLYTIVYTQLFSTPLEQWPAPAAGTIGLGTIQGQIGVVKTDKVKRDLTIQTQAPISPDGSIKPASHVEDGHEKGPRIGDDKTVGIQLSAELQETLDEISVPVAVKINNNGSGSSDPAGGLSVLENKTAKLRIVDSPSAAGSALALVLAIAAMVVA